MMQFFKDGSGQLSSMRLTQFLVVVTILLVFAAINAASIVVAIKAKVAPVAMIDFPVQAVLLVTAVIGGKVMQSIFAEKKDEAPDEK